MLASLAFLLILTARTMKLVWFNTFVTKLTTSRAFLGKKHHICIRERAGGSGQDGSQKEKQTLWSVLIFVSALKSSLWVPTHPRHRLMLMYGIAHHPVPLTSLWGSYGFALHSNLQHPCLVRGWQSVHGGMSVTEICAMPSLITSYCKREYIVVGGLESNSHLSLNPGLNCSGFVTLYICRSCWRSGSFPWPFEATLTTSSLVFSHLIVYFWWNNTCKVPSTALISRWCWIFYYCCFCIVSVYCLLHECVCFPRARSMLFYFIHFVPCETSTFHWLVDLFIQQDSNEDYWELISFCKNKSTGNQETRACSVRKLSLIKNTYQIYNGDPCFCFPLWFFDSLYIIWVN